MDTIARMTAEVAPMTIDDLGRAENVIRNGLDTFVEVGNALQEIRDGRGYRLKGYGTFEDYCRDEWNISRVHAFRLMQSAAVVENLLPIGNARPETESQARPLAALDPDQQVTAWNCAVETAQRENGGRVTAAIVQRAADEVKGVPHVAHNSGQNEWYTPPAYTEAARRVMGGIDLDPASSVIANESVKAAQYFTAETDGLAQKWSGRVWMNPPYSSDLIGLFCSKLTDSIAAGDVKQACVLVNNATDTAWFHGLLDRAAAVCFIRGRVKFIDTDGNATGAPLQGQTVLYLGGKTEKFAAEFSSFGRVLWNRE